MFNKARQFANQYTTFVVDRPKKIYSGNVEEEIPDNSDSGHTEKLLDFIERKLNGISHNKAKAILSGGAVRVNKRNITQYDYILKPGMIVEIRKYKNRNELKSRFVKIVYEDRWLMVIEKNTGVLSAAAPNRSLCVKQILDDYLHQSHQKQASHVVHRLDRDTSGLMIYAKTIEAQAILEENWHDIVTDRRYIAVLEGTMEEKQGTVRSWLKDNKAFITYSSPIDNGGKLAVTHYKTIKTNSEYSLVELQLETGRKNQIRVHMYDLNHPVVGDVKYGTGKGPIGRLALHAYRLDFFHPITREKMIFESLIPKKFKLLI